jgi:hypothetical protein
MPGDRYSFHANTHATDYVRRGSKTWPATGLTEGGNDDYPKTR